MVCDKLIDRIKNYSDKNLNKNNSTANKILIVPRTPGGTKMDGGYEKAYLVTVD